MQQVITWNTTPINGYVLTMQIRKWLKEEEIVNMETELSKFYVLLYNVIVRFNAIIHNVIFFVNCLNVRTII